MSREDLSAILDLAPTSISRLIAQGVLAKDEEGFPLVANVGRYVRHVAEAEKRRHSRAPEVADLAAKKAQMLAIQIAKEDRQIIMLDEALDAIDDTVGTFIEALSTWPRKLSRDSKEQQRLSDFFDAERNILSDVMMQKAVAFRAGTGENQVVDDED